MFVFAHLGIGLKICTPWSKGLPKRALLLGTLLPDLIDKPLYYGLSWTTGKRGADLGLICGTHTFGHTALFLIALSLAAICRKSRWLAALALGVSTHLLLDNLSQRLIAGPAHFDLVALLWPALGWHFPVIPFANLKEHIGFFTTVPLLYSAEAAGLLILVWEAWKTKNRAEIVAFIRERRQEMKKRRRRRLRSIP